MFSLSVLLLIVGAVRLAGCGGDSKGETIDHGWGDPERIADGYDPDLAVNASGSAVAVWLYYGGADSEVWAASFAPEDGWGTPERIATYDGFARYPNVALDPSGNAVAVWQHDRRDQRYEVWAAAYTPADGWQAPVSPDSDFAGDTFEPSIAMDAGGNAIAVWVRVADNRGTLAAARYTPTGGWGAVTRIDDDQIGYPSAPQVAMDPDGNATAIWNGDDGERGNAFANRFTVDGGWGTPENIDNRAPGSAYGHRIAMDAEGNAIAVWRQEEEDQEDWPSRIWANRFTPTSGWEAEPSRIESLDGAGRSRAPAIAMNARGEAVVVWQRWDEQTQEGAIWSNGYDPAAGWRTAALVEADYIERYDADPDVAIDPSGNALAVWGGVFNYRGTVWSSRYTPRSAWEQSVRLDTGGDVAHPKVGVDASGKGLAVWPPLTGGLGASVWSSRYGDGPWTDHTEVWQALCDGYCERAVVCFPEDVVLAECVSECMAVRERMPCDPNAEALDVCVAELEDWDCYYFEYEELPYQCHSVCSGPEGTVDAVAPKQLLETGRL
jgi:hypothetical protein